MGEAQMGVEEGGAAELPRVYACRSKSDPEVMGDKLPPVFDRSTPAGRAIYNTYHLKNDRQRGVAIGRKYAPPKRAAGEARPIVQPKPVGKNPAKCHVSVPKFRGGPQREWHPIQFVEHKKSQDQIMQDCDNYEEEQAPWRPANRSVESKKKELQMRFEYGPEYGLATKQRAKPKVKQARFKSSTEQALDEVANAIEERTSFLEEMKTAGMGEKYDAQIKGELGQLLKQAQSLQAKFEQEQTLAQEPSDDL